MRPAPSFYSRRPLRETWCASDRPWPFRRGNPGARRNFPAHSPARYCCPVEACHDAAPHVEDEPRDGFLGRRIERSVRPKRTRGRETLSGCPPKQPKTNGLAHPFGSPDWRCPKCKMDWSSSKPYSTSTLDANKPIYAPWEKNMHEV